MTPANAPASESFRVGEFVCSPVPDGERVYPRSAAFGADADPTVVAQYPDHFAVPYTPLLVSTGEHRVLLDTGAGPLAPATGRLQASLAKADCRPDEIDLVVLSHAHPDHIGGLIAEDGSLVFPNARIVTGRREYEFWHSSELRNRLGSGTVYGDPGLENLMGAWVDRYLPPIRDRLELESPNGEREVIPGVTLFDAPGHTPGQLGAAIHSGGETLLYTADAFAMAEYIAHPDWAFPFDLDRETAAATRRGLLDRAAADHCLVFHYHFARFGAVIRHGAGFCWEPAR